MSSIAIDLHGPHTPPPEATPAAPRSVPAWNFGEAEFPYQGTLREQLRFLLRYSRFAPSPYNTQPWLFRLQADAIEILPDRRRTLRHSDPSERQLWMSTGAVVAALRLAADHFGLRTRVQVQPSADLLAALAFSSAPKSDSVERSLFMALPMRRRYVAQFDPQTPSAMLLAALDTHAQQAEARLRYPSSTLERSAVRAIVEAAHQRRLADAPFCAELEDWLRADAVGAHDGIPQTSLPPGDAPPEFGAPEWSDAAGLTGRAKRFIISSASRARSCPVVAVLATAKDDAQHWLAAGALLLELELIARASGVWLMEFNQAVELPDLRTSLRASLALDAHPQTLIGLGYGAEVPALPRRPLEDMLLPDHSPVFAMH